MTEQRNEKLARLARELVAAAGEKNIVLRVLGGVAVYIACPSIETHPSLQREIKDIDVTARRSDFSTLEQVFAADGAVLGKRESSQITFQKAGIEIEVSAPDFKEDHRIDLAPRLELEVPTLTASDLLLVKLQRDKFADKDIKDSIALLLDHRVAKGQVEGQIDQEYIARLCGRDWGLFTTVYDNTVTLEKVLDKYLEPEEAQLVWRRIEQIQGEMDKEPKSVGWMLNQIIHRPTRVPA